jgi:hypothetical protein
LEFCCKKGVIPSVGVTNDWFTAMVPGYAKYGSFGETFKGSTFFHIGHNMGKDYEGRIYLEPAQGKLQQVHDLPCDLLVNPEWKNVIINPSRCAI